MWLKPEPNAFLTIVVIGAISFPVFLKLMPDIEQGRTEARITQAYNEVRTFAEARRDEVTDQPGTVDEDPWGAPYRFVMLKDGRLRVISSGQNMVSPKNGVDDDDIYSDMPTSPTDIIHAAKNQQWFFALFAWLAVWIVTAVLIRQVEKRW